MSEEEAAQRYDGVLLSIVQQAGGIDGFFEAVFGFLRRKTDFFTDQSKSFFKYNEPYSFYRESRTSYSYSFFQPIQKVGCFKEARRR